ncbi:MAG: 3-beta hydroxysteroid dehydrogenase [Hyphomicrobiales bacterium]|nr:3-beta hydroxysteroid dehydrogenase [Hyphomicrobiales bacterium]
MDSTHLPLVTIFGGSGFVGTQIVQLMARKGYRMRVAVRRPDLAGHLRPLGDVGQIVPIQANVRNLESVRRAVQGAGIVINLVGIRFESGRQRFGAVHVAGARYIAEASRAAGVKSLVHMSGLGLSGNKNSSFALSKTAGEAEVLGAFAEAVIIRPSIIFGPGDGFFNLMASLARLSPVLPLIGGNSRFQPVYVGDVADAFVVAAEGGVPGGRTYELGGPDIETHKQLLQRIVRETGRSNPLLPLPDGLAKLLAVPLSLLPKPLLTPDQVSLLGTDNVVSDAAIAEGRTLAAFGVTPTPMDAVLSSYLWRFRRHGQFDRQTA